MDYKNKDLPLFATVTGSQMWKMDTPESDYDVYSAYLNDSRDFLINGAPRGSKNTTYFKKFPQFGDTEKREVQEQSHELQKVIRYLIKGNLNFIFLVTSPVILYERGNSLQELRQIYIENISKSCYHSTLGMARNNMRDFILHGDKDSLLYKKKLNTIGRNLQFGINLLLYEKPFYQGMNIKSKDEIDALMIKLNDALDHSHLPEKTKPDPFEDYLIKWKFKKFKMDEYI